MIGISILFLSCSEQEFIITDTYASITNNLTFRSHSVTNGDELYDELSLFHGYPKLELAIKLSDSEINIKNYELISPNKDLVWDIEPVQIDINDQQYLGSSYIDLVSYHFEEGDYEIKLTSDDGRQISTTINISNQFNNRNDVNIYLKESNIIFLSNPTTNDLQFVSTLVPLEIWDLVVNYYDSEKNLLASKNYVNNFAYQNYQFKIKIDNFENVYYIELIYKDINSVDSNIKIDLSPSHSPF